MSFGENKKKYNFWLISFFVLIACNLFIWQLLYAGEKGLLKVAMLDIGQGDALYIESPNGHQMLVDGGKQGSLIKALPGVMSFYDKSIDVLVITNPDADHIGGFIDILKNYKVGAVIEPGTFNKSATYAKVKALIEEKNIPRILAKRGMKINLGEGVVFDVLFPDRDVSGWTANDGSIVGRLSYGESSVMFTGDATKKTETIILSENMPSSLESDILKAGHHGSRTSSSADFVKAVTPSYALISNGKNNTYGHPHKETLDTLQNFGVKIFRTDLLGTILFESDGKTFWPVETK